MNTKDSKQPCQGTPATGLVMLVFVLFALEVSPSFGSLPDYKVGETSRVDVVTPISLMVVDREKTEVLRQRENQKVPGIFRYYPEAIDEAEANLRGTFAFTREEFLEAMEINLKQRRLTMLATTRPNFGRLVANYQNRNKVFPLSTNLAQAWAVGLSDESFIAEWVARVRQVMHQYIRPDNNPPEARQGPMQVRLIIVRATNNILTLENVDQLSTRAYRTNFAGLSAVRKELQASLPPEEQAVGKFLSLFVKENCMFDQALTRQSRARQSESMWAADTYEPGQVILKSGETVTVKTKAALDELKSKTALQAVKAQAVEEALRTQLKGDQLQAQIQVSYQKSLEKTLFLLGGTVMALGIALFFLWRRRGKQVLLPAQLGQRPPWLHTQGETALLSCPACAETIIVDFPLAKRGGLAAGSEGAVTKPDGNGHVPAWLKDFVRKAMGALLWQRAMLLDTQRQAEMEVAALEKRLAKMNAPLQDRIKAYEKRIADLQQELAAERQQSAGVIQAQIDLTKQRLEREREKAPQNTELQ